ncbi:MAG: hypothetical protein LBN30_02030 [Oscillospiraceae bacterium]|jgi:hypothetical protein|nr:hypothetical protein [Oscillospiraceae bacterium]
MRFFKLFCGFLLTFSILFSLFGCGARPNVKLTPSVTAKSVVDYGFRRDTTVADNAGLKFTAWDVDAAVNAVGEQEKKARTVLIYMNGSDLESDSGEATADLAEIMAAGTEAADMNVVVFTGGANRWRNAIIPASECAISTVRDGKLEKLTGVGLRDMGDAGTLAGFIEFGLRRFPADKTSLILWDHGGGSIAGYGQDEKFASSSLTLLEMELAFEKAGLADARLELLGFDACLMATVEMAVIAERFADCLVASEGLEPSGGWDYTCLGKVRGGDGQSFGKIITDAFVASDDQAGEEVTLSVIDTSKAANVMGALGKLADMCLAGMARDERMIEKRRASTKTFGDGSPRGDPCDMVDIVDFARNLLDLYPNEATAVINAVRDAVPYCKYDSDKALGGLTAYHIYADWQNAPAALAVYSSLAMSDSYTLYLQSFADAVSPRAVQSPSVRTRIGGQAARMYETSRSRDSVFYAAPVHVNDGAADLIVRVKDGAATVMGYRREEGYMLQKGLDGLKDGDRVRFLSLTRAGWSKNGEITVTGKLDVEYNVNAPTVNN